MRYLQKMLRGAVCSAECGYCGRRMLATSRLSRLSSRKRWECLKVTAQICRIKINGRRAVAGVCGHDGEWTRSASCLSA